MARLEDAETRVSDFRLFLQHTSFFRFSLPLSPHALKIDTAGESEPHAWQSIDRERECGRCGIIIRALRGGTARGYSAVPRWLARFTRLNDRWVGQWRESLWFSHCSIRGRVLRQAHCIYYTIGRARPGKTVKRGFYARYAAASPSVIAGPLCSRIFRDAR